MGGDSSSIVSSVITVGAIAAAVALPGSSWLLPATMEWTAMGGVYVATGLMAAGSLVGGSSQQNKPGASFDFKSSASGRSIQIKQSNPPRRYVYGRCKISGAMSRACSNGSRNKNLHILWTLSARPLDAVEKYYLYDQEVELDEDGWVTTGDYAGLVRLVFGDGTEAGDATVQAIMEATEGLGWTSAHRQYGCAKLFMTLKHSQKFTGIPEFRLLVRGHKLYDPRDGSTAWSDNWALCTRDFLSDELVGIKATDDELPDAIWNAAANLCDEDVALADGGTEKRYTCNGSFTLDTEPQSVLESLRRSCRGYTPYVGGQFHCYPGAWREPTVHFDEDDLDGSISDLRLRTTRSELCNGVKGQYSDPETWQPTDYPAVVSDTFKAEDGGDRLWKVVDQAWTNSGTQAQRVATMELLESREQEAMTLPLKMTGLRAVPGKPVSFTWDKLGWNQKPFLVHNAVLAIRGDKDAPRVGIDLIVSATAESSFNWDTGMEQAVASNASTTLLSPFDVAAPTNLALESGTAALYTRLDGTVVSRIHVTWDEPEDDFVTTGGHIDIEYKRSADSDWTPAAPVAGDVTEAWLYDVQDGDPYDVRIRSRNNAGYTSEWGPPVTNHTVIGKTAPPSNVSSLAVTQNGDVCTYRWTRVADADLAGYELRYSALGLFAWASATVISSVTKGSLVTNAALPPGSWTVGIKAVDTSGNYSTAATTADIVVTSDYDVVYSAAQHPDWPGTVSNAVVHPVNGRIVPKSSITNSNAGWDTFDKFVPSPVSQAGYTAPEIDVGFDALGLRVYADMRGGLGPGETEGSPNPILQIDYRKSTTAYDGMEDWDVGKVDARYIKTNVLMRPADGLGYLSAFTPVVDVDERTEDGANVTIGAGGTAISFSASFHSTPKVWGPPSIDEDLFPVFSGVSNAGCICDIYSRTSGTSVGGTLPWWEAKGA